MCPDTKRQTYDRFEASIPAFMPVNSNILRVPLRIQRRPALVPFGRLLIGMREAQHRRIRVQDGWRSAFPPAIRHYVNPQGTDMLGQNSELNGAVLRSRYFISKGRTSGIASASRSASFGAGAGAVGVMTTSTCSKICSAALRKLRQPMPLANVAGRADARALLHAVQRPRIVELRRVRGHRFVILVDLGVEDGAEGVERDFHIADLARPDCAITCNACVMHDATSG